MLGGDLAGFNLNLPDPAGIINNDRITGLTFSGTIAHATRTIKKDGESIQASDDVVFIDAFTSTGDITVQLNLTVPGQQVTLKRVDNTDKKKP